jgi:hypothetical protein
MGSGVLFFDTNSSGANSTNSYDFDSFLDYALPPSNNNGLSSTISNNPLNQNFANNLGIQFSVKTLWIKDLIPVTDKTLWVNNLPTYLVVWHENFPQIQAYVCGIVNLVKEPCRTYINLDYGLASAQSASTSASSQFGVIGDYGNVQFFIEPTEVVTTGSSASNAGGVSSNGAINANYSVITGNSQARLNTSIGLSYTEQTHYIGWASSSTGAIATNGQMQHTALTGMGNARIAGVLVHLGGSGTINCQPGSAYVNRSKITVPGATFAQSTMANFRGGKTAFYLTPTNTWGSTDSPMTDIKSIAQGNSGTNLLSMSPGTGGSFPQGSVLYAPAGSTQLIGNVLTQSTDTLTMGITNPVGISGTAYTLFQAGSTFPIGSSNMYVAWDFDPSVQTSEPSVVNGFPYGAASGNTNGLLAFQDPFLRYRIWGSTLQQQRIDTLGGLKLGQFGATYGLAFIGSSSFLQIEGRFQALELEMFGGQSAQLNATVSIDGLPCFNYSEQLGNQGMVRRVIMNNAGPGFHNVLFQIGSGASTIAITRVTAYEQLPTAGPSLGVIAFYPVGQTLLQRGAHNATISTFGMYKRVYADSMYLAPGASPAVWSRGVSVGYVGGVAWGGSSTNAQATVNYYGTGFALLGALGAGASVGCVVDGTIVNNATMNLGFVGLTFTLGFHQIILTAQAGTCSIQAVDFLTPNGELFWNANSTPLSASMMPYNSIPGYAIQDYSISSQKLGLPNIWLSAPSGLTFNNTTSLTISTIGVNSGWGSTFICSGLRPVEILFVPNGITGGGVGSVYSSGGNWTLFKDGATFQMQQSGLVGGSIMVLMPATSIRFVDYNPVAGPHTYEIRWSAQAAGLTTLLYDVRTMIREIL